MRIGVVGLGYVGLVTAAVLANNGNSVTGVDVDVSRIQSLRSGKSPIFEPELDERIRTAKDNLEFSSDYSKLSNCETNFVYKEWYSFLIILNGRINYAQINAIFYSK